MGKAYQIRVRRISEVKQVPGVMAEPDCYLHIPERKFSALRQNPFLWETDAPIQMLGIVDGKVGGYNYIFPLEFKLDGKIYSGATGSSLNVQDWARPSCMGFELPTVGTDKVGKDGIAVAASCSQMAIPVHKINGYKFFMMPRLIALWKSRSVMEMLIKSRPLCVLLASVVDVLVGSYAIMLRLVRCLHLRGLQIREVGASDDDGIRSITEIIRQDAHRFAELHDFRWLKWHLTESFSGDGPSRAYLACRKGNPIGFYMVKRRYYEQASHRGFKHVWLGSIIEWGALPGQEKRLKGLFLDAALRLRRAGVDAFEFVTCDVKLLSWARRLGWRQVGESNYGVKVWPSSPLVALKKELSNPDNWRLRPAGGDNGLS